MREQFTFYRSFYEAISRLRKKEDRLSAYEAIAAYALNGESRDMTDAADALFILIKPNLDAAAKKSKGGKTERSKEEDIGKTEGRVAEDTSNKKKNEKENKKKDKKENECYARTREAFDVFWEAYPKKVGKKDAEKAFKKVKESDYPLLLPAIEEQKQSKQWQKDGGQFIPNPSTWLNQERWNDKLAKDDSHWDFMDLVGG